ncbi:MAG: hypothetical protein KAS05_00545 [Candidatus Omnitrophica bacterium]|nr:hypothetical protein [Candidatus Omnitrophota bacterium]
MKLLKIALVSGFSCLLFSALFAQTTTISGSQSKRGQFSSARLESEPVELAFSGKIIKVEGGRKGFWINRKDGYRIDNVYKFWNPDDAIGKKLSPGIYTIYPNLDKADREARVVIQIELLANLYNIPLQASSLEQYRYTKNNFYKKIFNAQGKAKIELCKKAIQGFGMAIDQFNDPKAYITKMLSAYNQAQCYSLLDDTEGYKRSLERCLDFTPSMDEQNESAISYSMSLYSLAERDLRELEAKE